MTSYDEVDSVIDAWVRANGLKLFTEWSGQPARFVYIPDAPPFECFQIQIELPSVHRVTVWARSVDTNDDAEFEERREGPLDTLDTMLREALVTTEAWRRRSHTNGG